MICCNHLTDIYPKEMQGKCRYKKNIINLEDCITCTNRFYNFKELEIGQFYFNDDTKSYYIKISNLTAFDLENNKVRYMGKYVNINVNNCLLCDYEVW